MLILLRKYNYYSISGQDLRRELIKYSAISTQNERQKEVFSKFDKIDLLFCILLLSNNTLDKLPGII